VATQPVVVMPAPLTRLAETALESLRGALDAFAGRDAAAEAAIRAAAEEAEAAYESLYRSSMAAMIANPDGTASAANLLFAAQSLAKVAGHSAEIARLVHFAATGRRPAAGGRIESATHAFS
jgi:phosphate transport system protein